MNVNFLIAVGVKLILGSLTYFLGGKLLYSVKTTRADGEFVFCQIPSFINWSNFVSMMLFITWPFMAEVSRYKKQCVMAGQPPKHPYSLKAYRQNIIPSFLNVSSIALSVYAGTHILPSLMIVLKGTKVIFSAAFTKLILGRSQERYQWAGVFICMLSLLPVVYSGQVRNQGKGKHGHDETNTFTAAKGIGFCVIGEFIRGIRYVVQEKLIAKEKMSVEFIVFIEAVLGLICATLMMLFSDLQGSDSFRDTANMIVNNPYCWSIIIFNIFASGIVTFAGTKLTKYVGSVMNAVISEMRIIVCFVLETSTFYATRGKLLKEAELHKYATPLMLLGSGLMIFSAFVYGGEIKLSCFPFLYPNGVKHGKGGHHQAPKQVGEYKKQVSSPATQGEETCCTPEKVVKDAV